MTRLPLVLSALLLLASLGWADEHYEREIERRRLMKAVPVSLELGQRSLELAAVCQQQVADAMHSVRTYQMRRGK